MAALAWVALRIQRRRPTPVAARLGAPSSPDFESFGKLSDWLIDDRPLVSSDDDMFQHASIAQRIAERLLEPKPPAQAVVGRLGAGKTTLRNLVMAAIARLGAERRLQIVPIELWPYETSRAAVEGVIRTLIDTLGR